MAKGLMKNGLGMSEQLGKDYGQLIRLVVAQDQIIQKAMQQWLEQPVYSDRLRSGSQTEIILLGSLSTRHLNAGGWPRFRP